MTRLASLPISYALAGRRVALVGDGERALQKARLLLRSAARIAVFAPGCDPALRALAAAPDMAWHARMPEPADLDGCALVVVATHDPSREAQAAACARAARIPVNVVDRADLSDFTIPAIIDRAPVAIAISTDGTAPVLAQRIRAAIEALLPPGLGRAATLAAGLRATVRARLPDAGARRRYWARLFDGAAASAAIAGDTARARLIALRALDSAEEQAPDTCATVYLVGAGPGAADLLTLRAQRLLQDADTIVHDDLVPDAVIDMARRDARRIAVGKRKGRHGASQTDINTLLVDLARAGGRVVRLKSGDPTLFGRAGEELAALRAAGIDVEIVPGVTAACAAAADAGVSLTLRGTASQVLFVTGHDAHGMTPAGWEIHAARGTTIALYMARSVAGTIAERLRLAGASDSLPAIAVENAGRPERRIIAGRLADLPALADRADLHGPVLLLVGRALSAADLATAEALVPPARRVA
jgi:uroporphyrin-III C-methyltransferase/precorrin-2 dehydrogenase/sirohydrochlorin ferrochelatase